MRSRFASLDQNRAKLLRRVRKATLANAVRWTAEAVAAREQGNDHLADNLQATAASAKESARRYLEQLREIRNGA